MHINTGMIANALVITGIIQTNMVAFLMDCVCVCVCVFTFLSLVYLSSGVSSPLVRALTDGPSLIPTITHTH